MDPATPSRRKTDRGWRWLVRDNAYRDAWLLVITGLVLWSLVTIQNQRWTNVRDNCEGANERYANTLQVIDAATAAAPKAQQQRAKEQRAVTLAFIAALAPPHLDGHGASTCHALADRQVHRWP
jgi:hypothetical protein